MTLHWFSKINAQSTNTQNFNQNTFHMIQSIIYFCYSKLCLDLGLLELFLTTRTSRYVFSHGQSCTAYTQTKPHTNIWWAQRKMSNSFFFFSFVSVVCCFVFSFAAHNCGWCSTQIDIISSLSYPRRNMRCSYVLVASSLLDNIIFDYFLFRLLIEMPLALIATFGNCRKRWSEISYRIELRWNSLN